MMRILLTILALMAATGCSKFLEKDPSSESASSTSAPVQLAMVNYKDAPVMLAEAMGIPRGEGINSGFSTAMAGTLLNMPATGASTELDSTNTFSYNKLVAAACDALRSMGNTNTLNGKLDFSKTANNAVNVPEWNGFIDRIAKAAWGRGPTSQEKQVLTDLKDGLTTDLGSTSNGATTVANGICEAVFLAPAAYLK